MLPGGLVLVAGGYNGSYLSSAELYDPAADTWSGTGSLSTARANHTATLLPTGTVLVAGGYNGAYLATAQLYDPALGTWSRHRQPGDDARLSQRHTAAQRQGAGRGRLQRHLSHQRRAV